MSGRVFSLKNDRKPESDGSVGKLFEAAEAEYFDHEGRDRRHGRIRASLHVLFGETERMQEQLREGLEMGGLLDEIPRTARYPLESPALAFSSEEELHEFTDEATAQKLIADQQRQRAESLSAYRQWAMGLMDDLSNIAEARLRGIEPDQIITTDDLRLSLTTEMVNRKMMASIFKNHEKVRQVIGELMKNSEAGVKAIPLAATMQQIGTLCQKMNEDMDHLAQTAQLAAGKQAVSDSDAPPPDSHSGVISLATRARQVFSPFIQGNHMVTMGQLRELESFLLEAGSYNENIGALLQDGFRAIQQAKATGQHKAVREIEANLDFGHQVAGFERISQALDRNFLLRSGILANTGAQNQILLSGVPHEMLAKAEAESGLLSHVRDIHLVLPGGDDLKSR